MNIFRQFSDVTGLKENKQKCRVYFGGTRNEIQQEILMETSFEKGSLPLKYLGIMLDSRKLSIAAFTLITDKILARIKHWTGKLLAYARRLQLVKSVLLSIASYWM